jgi:hypothetical protein
VIYVLIAAVGMLAVGTALLTVRRAPRGDDVERFHRARQMTTEWSRRYAATGHLDLPAPPKPEAPQQPVQEAAHAPGEDSGQVAGERPRLREPAHHG